MTNNIHDKNEENSKHTSPRNNLYIPLIQGDLTDTTEK